jgi:hypothetical protein
MATPVPWRSFRVRQRRVRSALASVVLDYYSFAMDLETVNIDALKKDAFELASFFGVRFAVGAIGSFVSG